MVYVISYDLRKPERDYPKIEEAIKSYGHYAHLHGSVWLVVTRKQTNEILEHLMGATDEDDTVFVAKLAHSLSWVNLDEEISEWIKKLQENHFK